MSKKVEPVIQILFLALSVSGFLIDSETYFSLEVWEGLFLTNIINAVITGLYLIIRFSLRKKNQLENLQRGMILFVVYSCPPLFAFIDIPFIKFLSILCFAGAGGLFLIMNLNTQQNEKYPELTKGRRLVFGILLLVFGVGFLGRGIGVIYQYAAGAAEIIDMLVSISDILISVIWLAVGTGFIRKKSFGNSNIFPCYIQASLLFAGLIVFLFVNPFITSTVFDLEAVGIIIVMSMFFFVPAGLLFKEAKAD